MVDEDTNRSANHKSSIKWLFDKSQEEDDDEYTPSHIDTQEEDDDSRSSQHNSQHGSTRSHHDLFSVDEK